MSYAGKLELKIKAQKLRKRGYSYKEILNEIHVSKDTISRWCKDIVLSKNQKQALMEKRILGQRKGSIIAAEKKRRDRILRTKNIHNEAKNELGNIFSRDSFIFGLALYAGEGTKSDGKGEFVNANPKLVQFMSNWFQRHCNIPLSKMRGAIWIHENNDVDKALTYWSNVSEIPKIQFQKTYISQNKTNSKKVRKNIHKYGVCAIRFYDSEK